ncbi:MAG TPA: FAD-binding oxidoreductase [Candidatus Limnocylindria bacterium]|nr:FAD-binding oxidoreductase [Candidatus Limnocylindria bacterium]
MTARVRADMVVVGAGIIGAATAYYLARRGTRVVLVDKGAAGGEQSGRAWGFVRRQGRPPAAMALMVTASRMWGGLAAELGSDIEFVRDGNLAVAETPDDVARLEAGYQEARLAGLGSRLVTAAEVRALIPQMQGRWQAGLYSEEDGHAEPLAVTTAFVRAAQTLGVQVWEHCTALGIDTQGDRVCAVDTDRGRVDAEHVVAAAGVWTSRLVEPLGVTIPLRVVRSSVAATAPAPPVTRIGVWGPILAFRQRLTGQFYLGNGYRGAAADHDITLASLRHLGFFLPAYRQNWRLLRVRLGRGLLADVVHRLRGGHHRFTGGPWATARVNLRAVRGAEREFHRLFPGLGHLPLERTWAGFIELTPDLLPVLGPVARPQGLQLGIGASHGFSMGPVIGRLLAEAIVDGRPSLDLTPFRHSRFRDGPLQPARKVL